MGYLTGIPSASSAVAKTWSRPAHRNTVLVGLAALALCALAPMPASAATPWRPACNYKMPSGIPGQGWVILNDYCTRLEFCQAMEDQGNRHLARMGCFGFVPSNVPAENDRRHE